MTNVDQRWPTVSGSTGSRRSVAELTDRPLKGSRLLSGRVRDAGRPAHYGVRVASSAQLGGRGGVRITAFASADTVPQPAAHHGSFSKFYLPKLLVLNRIREVAMTRRKAPAHLPDDVATVWSELASKSPMLGPGFEAFCGQVARCRAAQKSIAEDGLTIEDGAGGRSPNPALDIERRAQAEIRSWGPMFTPPPAKPRKRTPRRTTGGPT